MLSTPRFQICITVVFMVVVLAGCRSLPAQPIMTADYVDIDRFMGDWYVIANIPTYIEREAYNAVESYELVGDDRIETVFTFRDGGFDGDLKRYEPTGFVRDTVSNAVWGMRFIWPFKADYRILYVDDGYTHTVVGRRQRDYVWIMARSPSIPEEDYDRLVALVAEQGYDITQIRRVPQRWE